MVKVIMGGKVSNKTRNVNLIPIALKIMERNPRTSNMNPRIAKIALLLTSLWLDSNFKFTNFTFY